MPNRETIRQYTTLASLGVADRDAIALRRISLTLRSWFEKECGDGNEHASWSIERDPDTEKPYRVIHYHHGEAKSVRYAVSDRETGARKRLAQIMERYPHLSYYIQTDPRGAALHILRPGDVPEGESPCSYYSRGIALY